MLDGTRRSLLEKTITGLLKALFCGEGKNARVKARLALRWFSHPKSTAVGFGLGCGFDLVRREMMNEIGPQPHEPRPQG